MKTRYALAASVAALLAPLLASAQSGINLNAITPYSNGVINVINNILVPVLIAIAFIVFLWGIYKYFIQGAANETEKGEGRQFALWGIIGFVVILSLWGIVNLVQNTFGFYGPGNTPQVPTFNPGGTSGYSTNSVNYGSSPTIYGPVNSSNGATPGSTITNSNGTVVGTVNSNSQIVNSSGQVVGTCSSQSGCVTTPPNTGTNTCTSYGPGTGCITASGASGTCDSSNVCQPNATSGGSSGESTCDPTVANSCPAGQYCDSGTDLCTTGSSGTGAGSSSGSSCDPTVADSCPAGQYCDSGTDLCTSQ